MTQMIQPGQLYIVATPIGNRDDISQRGVRTLTEVDYIAAEDTRHTAKLLSYYGITTPAFALHAHNEVEASAKAIRLLQQGRTIALVSDAGTPLINDPGYRLVTAALAAQLPVTPIPGPSAVITALSIAGLPTDCFTFHGFIPAKTVARAKLFHSVAKRPETNIFYESPHRIVASLQQMQALLGGARSVVVARELTKQYETVLRGSIAEVLSKIETDQQQQKGEFVLLLQGYQASTDAELATEACEMLTRLARELPLKKAAALTADLTGEKKNRLYAWALQQTEQCYLTLK